MHAVRASDRASSRPLHGNGPGRALRGALASAILSDESATARVDPGGPIASRSAIEAFVDGRFGLMALHVRAGVAVIEWLLVVRCFARTGRGPGSLSPAAAARLARSWEASRLPPIADYVRLVRSLVVLAAFDTSAARPSLP